MGQRVTAGPNARKLDLHTRTRLTQSDSPGYLLRASYAAWVFATLLLALPLMSAAATTPFLVRQLRVDGNTVFDTATLQALLASMLEQRLTLPQIAQGIDAVTTYYREAGYPLARAIIPAQVIENGVVRMQVIEANWGHVELRNNGAVQDAVLMRMLSNLEPGSVIRLEAMERATLLLSDLPGVVPRALLRAGQEVGRSDLVVDVQPGAPWSASLSADNFGSRYTGVGRTNANVQWNNPLGRGDTLGVSSLISESGGLNYARLAYEVPVLVAGMHAGVDNSGMQYRLGDNAGSLMASGKADTSSAWLRSALVRSPNTNLNARLSWTNNVLQDHEDSTGVKTDRTLNVWGLELSGERQDGWLGGGKNTLGFALYSGQVTFDDDTAGALDAITAQTAGGFGRATWALGRTQALGSSMSAVLSLNGQWAQKNLDNGQKFSIGGASSVRAYRSGVLSGDSGAFGSFELRYTLPTPQALEQTGTWQLIAFIDSATVQTNHSPWSNDSNEASLSGAGLGLIWQGSKGVSSRIFIASSVGELPSQLAGSESTHTNAWWELSWAF
ncbi:MAG: ShlB/FhaC/HecB family hemolysin secretion/activation protein [Betaproteobacteria bacterium]|nr:ShlB/FhaC/HecB family hemolysin secretion/activation protein [Betaproteobacteria bacterium]